MRRQGTPVHSKLVCMVAAMMASITAVAASHPMDPLDKSEIAAAVDAVKKSGELEAQALFPIVRLYEMPKSDVVNWKPGQPIARKAEVSVMEGVRMRRAIVDLGSGTVESWRDLPGQAPFLITEFFPLQALVKSNDAWLEGIKARGVTDPAKVVCLPFSTGHFGDDANKSRRLFRVGTYYTGDAANFWGRPLEGLIAVVDLIAREVLEVIDTGAVPIPDGPVDYAEDKVGPLREAPVPIEYAQDKPSFSVDGHMVRWQNWTFHVRMDPQAGVVLSNVTYRDGDRERSILYQAHLSELFVPYMDPGEQWYFKTFFDAGENNVGQMTSRLLPGLDCPKGAHLMAAEINTPTGGTRPLVDAIAIFEQYAGNPAWRHDELIQQYVESRRAQDLVVRHIATIGNYDYLFDYVFNQSGAITIRVGATGIDSAKAVNSRTAAEDPTGEDGIYGRFVGPNTVGVNHDHFLSFRLDLDVDGTANSLVVDALQPVPFEEGTPRTSGWVVNAHTVKNEADSKLNMNLMKPAQWRIVNPAQKNAWGHNTSFHIQPSHSAVSHLHPDDWPQKRGMFSKYNLHVTPYNRDERFAAGDFPNQGHGEDGLDAWMTANRAIENTDIVAWYTLGFHHVVRAEDWPVMPTTWHEFTLRPFDFFDRNPAINLPKNDS